MHENLKGEKKNTRGNFVYKLGTILSSNGLFETSQDWPAASQPILPTLTMPTTKQEHYWLGRFDFLTFPFPIQMNLSFYSFLGEKNIGGLRGTLSATKKHDEQAFGPVPKTFGVGRE